MTEPRIVRLAAAARECGAQGLKVDERHPMLGGAQLRLWAPDSPSAWSFRRAALDLGYQVPLMAPHLWSADEIRYDGWQFCIVIPAEDLTMLRRELGTPRPAIDLTRGEIGP